MKSTATQIHPIPQPTLIKRKLRILIADDDTPLARRMSEQMQGCGYELRTAAQMGDVKDIVEFWQPDLVFLDLLLPPTNALALFRFLDMKRWQKRPHVIVMSKQTQPQSLEEMKRAGANGHLLKPFTFEEALESVSPFIHPPSASPSPFAPKSTGPTPLNVEVPTGAAAIKELHLMYLLLKQAVNPADREASFYNLMRMINLKVKGLRCSIIQCLNDDTGLILAANDSREVRGLSLSLDRYPEVREVMRTGQSLLIPDIREYELLSPVREKIAAAGFESLALFPISCPNGSRFGALSVRMSRKDPSELFYIEKFGQVCAGILGLLVAGSSLS